MASFAEMIYGTANDVTKSQGEGAAKSFQSGYESGAELAMKQEALQQQRAQLQQKMAELEQAKMTKIHEYIKDARNYKNPKDRNNYLKSAIGYRNVLGIKSEVIPDETILSLGSDENQGRMAALDIMMQNGEITPEQYLKTVRDPQLFGKVQPLIEDAKYDTDTNKTIENILNRRSQEKSREAAAQNSADRGAGIDARFKASQKTKLADKLNGLGIPGMRTALSDLNKYVPGGLDNYKSGTNIPGISGADAALPVNRLKGDGLNIRQSAMSLGNQILKMRSGAAVSTEEAARLLAELGMVPTVGEGGTWTGLTWKGTTTPEAFISGMRRAQNLVKATEQTFKNAYGSDTYEQVTAGVGDTSGVPQNAPMISLFGKAFTREQWKQFLAKHPNDPTAPAIKKALGE